MKKLILSLLVLCPFMLHAGIIVKQSGENIEDVTIKSITDTEIIYVAPNGKQTSIPRNNVSALLYDDGRYEEIRPVGNIVPAASAVSESSTIPSIEETEEPADKYAEKQAIKEAKRNAMKKVFSSPEPTPEVEATPTVAASNDDENIDLTDAKEFNVYAFGVYGMIGYFAKSEYDGANVEYRVIYKSSGATEFKYLGTAPFAYVTQKAYDSPLMKSNAAFASMMSVNPLIIPNYKDVKSVEFRLSKNGYKTVVVKPLRDALLVGGLLMMLPMNKLKPEK